MQVQTDLAETSITGAKTAQIPHTHVHHACTAVSIGDDADDNTSVRSDEWEDDSDDGKKCSYP